MSLLALPQYLLDGWSVCEALRRFGFSQEEMTVGFGEVAGVGDEVLYVRLQSQGIEFFACAARVPGGEKESILSEWTNIWESIEVADDDEMAIALARSLMGNYSRVIMLAAELISRGMNLPSLPSAEQGPLSMVGTRAISMSPGGTS